MSRRDYDPNVCYPTYGAKSGKNMKQESWDNIQFIADSICRFPRVSNIHIWYETFDGFVHLSFNLRTKFDDSAPKIRHEVPHCIRHIDIFTLTRNHQHQRWLGPDGNIQYRFGHPELARRFVSPTKLIEYIQSDEILKWSKPENQPPPENGNPEDPFIRRFRKEAVFDPSSKVYVRAVQDAVRNLTIVEY